MNLTTIQKRIYRRCGLADTPATADITRILDFINEWYRETLSAPGMDRLRDTTLSLTTVASQAQYGLPQAISRIHDPIFDVTNQRCIYEKSLAWLRMVDPGLTATSATVDYWIPLRGWGATAQTIAASGKPLYVVSDSASDGVGTTAHVETVRLGGIRAGDTSVAMNGVTRAQLGAKGDHIEVTKFWLTAAAVGTVSLYDASSSGNIIAQITPGRTNARYFMIQLYPTVSAALSLSIDCQRTIEDLTLPNEEPLMHEDYQWLLVYGALSEEMEKRDSTQATKYEKRARKLQSDLRHNLYPQEIAVQRGPMGSPEAVSRLGGWFPADR